MHPGALEVLREQLAMRAWLVSTQPRAQAATAYCFTGVVSSMGCGARGQGDM